MRSLVWLASYPKAGNTWFRIFLETLATPGDQVDVNQLHLSWMASNRVLVKEWSGLDTADLTERELLEIRQRVWALISQRSAEPVYIKIHDVLRRPGESQMVIPESSTLATVYLVRNPLDGCISLANHMGIGLDAAIEWMGAEHFLGNPGKGSQVSQHVGNWSRHVESWTQEERARTLVVRFEDMRQSPAKTFMGALEHIGLRYSGQEVEAALNASRFEKLRASELADGFRERPQQSKAFFRKAQVGEWREVLTSEQVSRIIRDHRQVMTSLGYLDDAGLPAD